MSKVLLLFNHGNIVNSESNFLTDRQPVSGKNNIMLLFTTAIRDYKCVGKGVAVFSIHSDPLGGNTGLQFVLVEPQDVELRGSKT